MIHKINANRMRPFTDESIPKPKILNRILQ